MIYLYWLYWHGRGGGVGIPGTISREEGLAVPRGRYPGCMYTQGVYPRVGIQGGGRYTQRGGSIRGRYTLPPPPTTVLTSNGVVYGVWGQGGGSWNAHDLHQFQYLSAVAVSEGGVCSMVSAWGRGVCQTPPPLWTESQTGVKTLPCRTTLRTVIMSREFAFLKLTS